MKTFADQYVRDLEQRNTEYLALIDRLTDELQKKNAVIVVLEEAVRGPKWR